MPLQGHAIEFENLKDAVNTSPYYRHLNIRLVEFTEEGCIMTMEIEESHLSVYGRTHGGAIASLADCACSLALATAIKENEFIATQSLNVHYISPVENGILKAKGWIVHRGRHTAILEADLFDPSGNRVAHAHSVHVIREIRSLSQPTSQ